MIDPTRLAVWQNRDQIVSALESNQVIIVESPTGSGKTTQLPVILKNAGYTDKGVVGITQPRRIATLSVCEYIQKQIAPENLDPAYCGYKMRFYDTTSDKTRIKILTDGMLLQEMKTDPLLSRYSVIMVDEAHERSLNIDFILGLLKQICAERPDLKVIISSATINTKVFSTFFADRSGRNAPVISIKGRIFNVNIKYYPIENSRNDSELPHAVCQILNQVLKQFKASDYTDNQDTLVFLPGEAEIKDCISSVYEFCDHSRLQIYPLYGRLNKEEQELVFEETQKGKMKVVFATNIAETSLTIDGIRVVIDSGVAKMNFYNQNDFTSSLVVRTISRASADQRAGRAGRTSEGTCYRLYSKEDYEGRPKFTREEILRTDLSEVVLRMVDLGIRDFERFPFITKPDKAALHSGENTLLLLDAIDRNRNLTSIGAMMVRYPLLPRLSRCIVEAVNRDIEIIRSVIICVSFLSCKTPFVMPQGEEDAARHAHKAFNDTALGDFVGYQRLFEKYTSITGEKMRESFCSLHYLDKQSMDEIVHVVNQLCEITREMEIPVSEQKLTFNEDFARRCMLCLGTGLIQYICVKKKTSYRTITADEIYIHPGSSWFRVPPAYILAGEIVQTSKLYARTVSPLNRKWIEEISPSLLQKLSSLSKKGSQEKEKERSQSKAPGKQKRLTIYGMTFDFVPGRSKKEGPVLVIPHDKLQSLSRAYKKASRHPKNVSACISYNGYYIHYGDRLRDIIRLSGRIHFENARIVRELPAEIYYPDSAKAMIPYLKDLMCFSELKKYKNQLGFVELCMGGRGIFFHVNKFFSEAVNNTAYSLLAIMDENNDKQFSDAYNKLVRLLD
ncbi:MAG: ATP-dependent RNA helicase [Sphaerochaetaceae bacterium]|nr:ATP-dependent RNA helicase [Sphaerochaetaceae bacterium]